VSDEMGGIKQVVKWAAHLIGSLLQV